MQYKQKRKKGEKNYQKPPNTPPPNKWILTLILHAVIFVSEFAFEQNIFWFPFQIMLFLCCKE